MSPPPGGQEQDVLIDVHEAMACSVFATRLVRFVGVDRIEVDRRAGERRPGSLAARRSLIGDLRHRLAPVYHACRARFGDQLPVSWRV